LFGHVAATVNGLQIIHAYNKEQDFLTQSVSLLFSFSFVLSLCANGDESQSNLVKAESLINATTWRIVKNFFVTWKKLAYFGWGFNLQNLSLSYI